MRPFVRPALAVFGLVVLAFAPVGAKDLDDHSCIACHADVVKSFQHSPHSKVPGGAGAASCQGCHGDATAHMESGDPADIRNLAKLSPRESSNACLECHSRQETQAHVGRSLHALDDVGCADCHNPHGATENMLVKPAMQLCSSCHTTVAAQFSMPRHHPTMGEDGCTGCHDPHGTKNDRMARGAGKDTCVACHADKQGPYIYPHDVSIVEGCSSCHDVHGSTNRHLLRHERQANLCFECHAVTTTPGFHNFGRFLGEKCTVCHTAIHGSNTNAFYLEE